MRTKRQMEAQILRLTIANMKLRSELENITMQAGMTAMTHEYDGGQCWCGPKCDPVEFVPVEPCSACGRLHPEPPTIGVCDR